jgi:hypothetical protein
MLRTTVRFQHPRLVVLTATATALAIVLSGCTQLAPRDEPEEAPTATQFTLEEAKAFTIEARTEMAAYLPEDAASEVREIYESNALIPCSGDDEYVWPGPYIAVLDADMDQQAVLDAIAAEWESRDDWLVERRTNDDDYERVLITSANGAHFAVGFHVQGSEFWIDAYSPCFHLPGGFVGGELY